MVSHVAVSVAQQPTRARRRITCNCRASLFSQPRLRLVPCPYRLQTTGITLTFWKSGLERGTEEVEGKKCPNTKPRIGFIHLATCILQLWEPAAKIMCRDHIRYRRRKRGGKKASTQLEQVDLQICQHYPRRYRIWTRIWLACLDLVDLVDLVDGVDAGPLQLLQL